MREYGPEWNSKLETALVDFEERLKKYGDPAFEQLLLQVQEEYGLSDYETFLVGENSTYPTPDSVWQGMGPRFSKFVGQYLEDVGESLPLGGDEKYIKQQQSDIAVMPVNVASKMYEDKDIEKSVKVGKRSVEYDICPHCNKEICEKHIYSEDNGKTFDIRIVEGH